MEKEKPKHRIGWLAIIVLLLVSGIADLTTLIPLVGDFVGPVFWICMSWYLWKTKHGLINWKNLVPELISLVAELIQIVQEFPTIIGATIVIIVISRLEDKTGIKLTPPSKIKPLNQGGVRKPSQMQ